MKFLLLLHVNPDVWNALTQDEQTEIMDGHGQFIEMITTSSGQWQLLTQKRVSPYPGMLFRASPHL